MTAQNHDRLVYDEDLRAIVGVDGGKLPTPHDFDMKPIMWSTACYRGYMATYTCIENDLFLTELVIGYLAEGETWKPIQGIMPETRYASGYSMKDKEPVEKTWANGEVYHNLRVETYFSGGILVGTGFINSLYVHMGFGKPYQFEHVHELLFHEGSLVKVIDQSEKAAVWREQVMRDMETRRRERDALRAQGLTDAEIHQRMARQPSMSEMQEGIQWRFSLDYREWF